MCANREQASQCEPRVGFFIFWCLAPLCPPAGGAGDAGRPRLLASLNFPFNLIYGDRIECHRAKQHGRTAGCDAPKLQEGRNGRTLALTVNNRSSSSFRGAGRCFASAKQSVVPSRPGATPHRPHVIHQTLAEVPLAVVTFPTGRSYRSHSSEGAVDRPMDRSVSPKAIYWGIVSARYDE